MESSNSGYVFKIMVSKHITAPREDLDSPV